MMVDFSSNADRADVIEQALAYTTCHEALQLIADSCPQSWTRRWYGKVS